jgi:LysR family transcriptional regulator, glycine cleavage system transcriptional activator
MKQRLPSLNGLRAFEAAARHLSFTKAADDLNVTQTAVSHQIKRLEDELGLQLFIRRNRRLLLTEAGQDYLPAVRAAFEGLHDATARLYRRDESGTLVVATMAPFAMKWLVPRLAGFQQANPDISVRITTGNESTDFARDDVDLAIRWGRGDWPGLRVDHLVGEAVFPICSPELRDGPPRLERPEDLAGVTLLHANIWPQDWRMWLTAVGVADKVDASKGLEFEDELTAMEAAIDGQGVAIGWSTLIERELESGRLVVPFDISLGDQGAYYIVVPEETAERAKIAVFRDWLLNATRGEADALARPGIGDTAR